VNIATFIFTLISGKDCKIHMKCENELIARLEANYIRRCIKENRKIWLCGTTIERNIIKDFRWDYQTSLFN
jgi:hypothetical protein